MGLLKVLFGLTVADELLINKNKQKKSVTDADDFDPEQDCAECGEYWEDCECEDCDCDEEGF